MARLPSAKALEFVAKRRLIKAAGHPAPSPQQGAKFDQEMGQRVKQAAGSPGRGRRFDVEPNREASGKRLQLQNKIQEMRGSEQSARKDTIRKALRKPKMKRIPRGEGLVRASKSRWS